MRHTVPVLLVCAIAAVGGCSAPPDVAVDPNATPLEFHVSDDPGTQRRVETYTTGDDATLAYTAHSFVGGTGTAIVYLHGIESHGGWFEHAADLLCGRGFDVYCLDRRGSGINRENRGFPSGHVDAYETLLDDIAAFIDGIDDDYDRVYLTGLSWGGKLGLGYALTHPETIDGLVMITPGLRSIVDVDLPTKLRIFFGSGLNPRDPVKTPIEPEQFTTTPRFLAAIRSDPLRLHYATARFFMEGEHLGGTIDRRMPRATVPMLLVLAGHDTIIDNDAVLDVLERADDGLLETVTYEDQTHSIQFDAPERLVSDMARWIWDQEGRRP
ncbi:MAG: alpha/beta hydrolase [Planctomycetes bacterium]|nr:alpha/beta hydrolase [Planctomycetota bacterium]